MEKEPSIFEALLPLVVLVALLAGNVALFDDPLGGANQSALFLSAAVAAVAVWFRRRSFGAIMAQVVETIGSAVPPIIILLLVGSLSGTWMIGGIVPALIYYGLDLINPAWFLVTSVLVCAIVSLVTGSSWSTVATVGVALMGIGEALNISEGMTAGAIISGAYFGDKVSPLSDTTNLASAMANVNLFTHVRYMMFTTVPSFLLTCGLFLFIGYSNYGASYKATDIEEVKTAIDAVFHISPWLFLAPVGLFIIILLKTPPVPALLAGTILGALFALLFQFDVVHIAAGPDVSGNVSVAYAGVMQAFFGAVTIPSDNVKVCELLSTGGMSGMLSTVWLILSAMIFGGVMESGGLLLRLTRPMLLWAKNTGSLVATAVVTCIFFNFTASDQYLSIVVTGRMFRKAFSDKKLMPEVLSRTLEDSGTMTSVLVPWNTCGAAQSKVLGVATITYLPYCFFNLISPIMSILFAYLNIKIRRKG
ncbi:MAG: Na+/H+ antiporter NhaC [Bacteroidales bacterium]|jgi:NhaC family Na+:H+ antiporter|nr:Na+/H+ antiporter NhaC [Bacteroidales bacterium]